MKNLFVFTLMVFAIAVASFKAKAQNNSRAQEIELINQTVFKPTVEGFKEYNPEKAFAVYSEDAVMISPYVGEVFNFQDYKARWTKLAQDQKQQKLKRSIDMRFRKSYVKGDMALFQGVLKMNLLSPDGKENNLYFNFEAVLRKENGTWKMLSDNHSSLGNTITEKDYLAAQPLASLMAQ